MFHSGQGHQALLRPSQESYRTPDLPLSLTTACALSLDTAFPPVPWRKAGERVPEDDHSH